MNDAGGNLERVYKMSEAERAKNRECVRRHRARQKLKRADALAIANDMGAPAPESSPVAAPDAI